MSRRTLVAFTLLFLPTLARAEALDPLVPGPGRVPLMIESAGAPQPVSEVLGQSDVMVFSPRGGMASGRALHRRRLCTTPCTLYVRPGTMELITGGGESSVREVMSYVEVPTSGTRVTMHASSRAAYTAGFWLTSGGAGFLGAGAIVAFTGFILPGNNVGNIRGSLLAYGGICAGIGVLALIPGIVLLATNPGGVQKTMSLTGAPRASRLQWTIAPTRGGVAGALALSF